MEDENKTIGRSKQNKWRAMENKLPIKMIVVEASEREL
jgi:hypothetical protein